MTGEYESELRQDLINTCVEMAKQKLSFGTSGNASVRLDKGTLLITPTGQHYKTLKSEDIVAMTMDGTYFGRHQPSSEWRFHRDILLERVDVNAIVHTHSQFATTLACRREGIPAFHYMVAVAGGKDIRCADYATFGSEALSVFVLDSLKERHACLLANHGQIALGKDLFSALKMAGEVESLAKMYWHSCQGGSPAILEDTEMSLVLEKFKTYGSSRHQDEELKFGGTNKLPA